VLPATTATEIWDVSGVALKSLDPATIMTAEDCVDAALAGLDRRETVTLPSVEDPKLWAAFDDARVKLFAASQTGKPASRYGVGRRHCRDGFGGNLSGSGQSGGSNLAFGARG
jgi:uncharacterized protein